MLDLPFNHTVSIVIITVIISLIAFSNQNVMNRLIFWPPAKPHWRNWRRIYTLPRPICRCWWGTPNKTRPAPWGIGTMPAPTRPCSMPSAPCTAGVWRKPGANNICPITACLTSNATFNPPPPSRQPCCKWQANNGVC